MHDTQRYAALSLRDLLEARDQYHVHLMRQPNVVGTSVGYYRIRAGDTPPGVEPVVKGTYARTFTNSEICAYSWPAVLVLVSEWKAATDFADGAAYDPDEIVPKTLYLKDGRRVPVCVIEAPKEPLVDDEPIAVAYPLNNLGSGQPVTVTVQEREHIATIACLVDDGHRTYALTNLHVTGFGGEASNSPLGGRERRVGTSARLSIARKPFSEVYGGWPGEGVFLNMDVGLVDITDLNGWTARLRDKSVMGPMIDLSSTTFPLGLVGQPVRGWGAASGEMAGAILGLFYRYKSRGGFEYVADFLIGPRGDDEATPFATRPGDSGTLWLLEASEANCWIDGAPLREKLRPLAVQWGANRLYSALAGPPQSYALATCLSTVCNLLNVDVVRDWNLDQPDTWGAVGHFAIAGGAAACLSAAVPGLKGIMEDALPIIGHPDTDILDSTFGGMGDDAFVPMADVPDFFWKHGKQGHSRPLEGPNHFADMDQKRDSDGKDLLSLCEDDANVDPDVWNEFYDSVRSLEDGTPIEQRHRGLIPFRVWQIFDAMVGFAGPGGDLEKFVCAAGVLAHYVGDACQPLHISYLHDGDPLNGRPHTVHHHDGTTSDVVIPKGVGVHAAYEDGMVNSHRRQILDGLDETAAVTPADAVANGRDAAIRTVGLMRDTFRAIPPASIVSTFVGITDRTKSDQVMWSAFGDDTIGVMQDGVHLLASLWESAWTLGGAEGRGDAEPDVTQDRAMEICGDADFLPSLSIGAIGRVLNGP